MLKKSKNIFKTLTKSYSSSLLITAIALSLLTACNASVPGLEQESEEPLLTDKQAEAVNAQSEDEVSDKANLPATANVTGADVNGFWARATQGGITERFVQKTPFGTHLINPEAADLTENDQPQGPLFVGSKLTIGVLNNNNFYTPVPLNTKTNDALRFVTDKTLREAKFVWASDAKTLQTIYLRLDSGELHEINGPFDILGTGQSSTTPDPRPLLQQLLESTAQFNQVGQQVSPVNAGIISRGSSNTSDGSQNTGNTLVIGGGSSNFNS